MKDITIICCWNDKKQYQRLIDSIKIQDIKVNISSEYKICFI